MKDISTLIPDMEELLKDNVNGVPVDDSSVGIAMNIVSHLTRALDVRDKQRELGRLYVSDIGKKCPRALWYSYHTPDIGEKLPPNARFKFLYGDVIEEMTLYLAAAAGHTVEHMQARIEFKQNDWTISGRMDAVIDGHMVDVKSASPYGYNKIVGGLTDSNDAFGYREQVSTYKWRAVEEGLIKDGPVYILANDKQNGNFGLATFPAISPAILESKIETLTNALDSDHEPARAFAPVPEGKSGNEKISMECGYCAFKHKCWPGLQGYSYSGKPVWLTKVVREPRVAKLGEYT